MQTAEETKTKADEAAPPKEQPPKSDVVTRKEHEDALNAEKGNNGRLALQVNALTMERDTLKAQVASISDLNTKIADLDKQLDEIGKADPAKGDLIALRKQLNADLKAEREQFTKDRAELDASKQTHAEPLKAIEEEDRAASVFEVASQYEGGDAVKLRAAADKLKLTGDSINALAETMWSKKAVAPKEDEHEADSGLNQGGNEARNVVKFGKDAPSVSEMLLAGLKKK